MGVLCSTEPADTLQKHLTTDLIHVLGDSICTFERHLSPLIVVLPNFEHQRISPVESPSGPLSKFSVFLGQPKQGLGRAQH